MQLFLFLVFLLSHVAMVAAVAGCLSDRDKDHRPRQNCTAAGFNDIPAGFELTTMVLLFPNNLIPSLSWTSFQIFPDIYEIDLTGNKVPEVTPSATLLLPSLSVLRLGSNRLTSLSDGSFSACPALTELYLDNNIINSLSNDAFSGLSKLEILDLTSNHIKVLPTLMLHPLPAIETLFLENNKIKVMPDDWFSQKEEVPYLYLSANPWACFCSLSYLQKYLDEYEMNIYVRDGLDIKSDGESVVCDSPPWLKGKPVMTLEESDLCSPSTESTRITHTDELITTDSPYKTSSAATSIPAATSPPPPPPPPPTTTATTPATTPATPLTSLHTTSAFVETYTRYYREVTRSWYQTFTSLIEWSNHSGSEVEIVKPHPLTTHATLFSVRTSKPVKTTKPVPLTVASTTLNHPTTTTTTEATTQSVPSMDTDERDGVGSKVRSVRAAAAGVFCVWLFAGCLLLCVASVVCILATLTRLVIWYRRMYKPLVGMLAKRGGGGGGREGVMLSEYRGREEKVAGGGGGGGGGGGVLALYRSVLFVQTEGGEAVVKEDGGEEGEREERPVTVEATAGAATREEEVERGASRERGVYRKTLYRLLSKEEEIGGWRDVMEECQVSLEDGGRTGGGSHPGMDRGRSRGGGDRVSKKRYSVILREEREETGGGREELDWVVGGWEGEPRSSWGEWLANYLPSMPWGVTTPPEDEASK